MINKLLQYICCPGCKADLLLQDGALFCSHCKEKYDFVNDIPVLIDLNKLPTHLVGQIKYFENEFGDNAENTKYKLQEWQRNYVERFKTNFNRIENKLVIDCGTGSGYMAIEIAKIGANVIACDLTLKSVLRLKKIAQNMKIAERFTFICCSVDNLPFKDGIADYLISNAVLEHIPREKEAINEIYRVCKNDAGLMITVPLSYRYLNPLLMPINYLHDKRIGHLRRYNLKTLISKFGSWNFTQAYYTGHFVKVFKVLVNLLIYVFDEAKIEIKDMKKNNNKWGASNIIVIFRKMSNSDHVS